MDEQANAVTSYAVGPAVWGSGLKGLAYSSTATTATPLLSKRYIRVSCGFARLEGKRGVEFSEKVRIPEAWYFTKPAYEVPVAVVP